MNMKWNYRVVKKTSAKDKNSYYEIMEIYYDENGEVSCYADADLPYGENIEEIKSGIELILKALDKPIIEI